MKLLTSTGKITPPSSHLLHSYFHTSLYFVILFFWPNSFLHVHINLLPLTFFLYLFHPNCLLFGFSHLFSFLIFYPLPFLFFFSFFFLSFPFPFFFFFFTSLFLFFVEWGECKDGPYNVVIFTFTTFLFQIHRTYLSHHLPKELLLLLLSFLHILGALSTSYNTLWFIYCNIWGSCHLL